MSLDPTSEPLLYNNSSRPQSSQTSKYSPDFKYPTNASKEDPFSGFRAGSSSSYSGRQTQDQELERMGDATSIIRTKTRSLRLLALVKPFSLFILGLLLALGHHGFNSWANGRPVGISPSIPQAWVIRVGNAFAIGFHVTLVACVSFVVCQFLWLSTRRNFLTIKDIDTLYKVERRDVVSTIFSKAFLRAPFLVTATSLSLLLPIVSVFTPASLSVSSSTPHSTQGACSISAADFSSSLYSVLHQGGIFLSGFTPTVQKLAESAFYGGTIVPLPAYCGPNCTYSLMADSFTFECVTDAVTLPDGQMGTYDPENPGPGIQTFWNATLSSGSDADHDPTTPIYVGWATGSTTVPFNSSIGSSGAALCTPRQATYEFQVQKLNGLQTVTYTTTPTDPMLSATTYDANNRQPSVKALQLGAMALATRELLLGSLSVMTNPAEIVWSFNSTARAASFLNMGLGDTRQFVWGDVIGGIQQTAANVTASMLNLNLGMQNSTCLYTQTELVYSYHRLNLWLPYGIALVVVLASLIFGALVYLQYNPDNLTTSFTDTIGITRNRDLDSYARLEGGGTRNSSQLDSVRFRLGNLGGGYIGYGAGQEFDLNSR